MDIDSKVYYPSKIHEVVIEVVLTKIFLEGCLDNELYV